MGREGGSHYGGTQSGMILVQRGEAVHHHTIVTWVVGIQYMYAQCYE